MAQRRKKKGYNWKARQQTQPKQDQPHLDFDLESEPTSYNSNAYIMPPRKRVEPSPVEPASKRKKLSCKQRRKLQKVLDTKEKKAKRTALLKSLSSLALPDAQMLQLHTSSNIGQTRKTNKQIHALPNKPQASMDTTTRLWRKNRKRRQVRAEKKRENPTLIGIKEHCISDNDGSDGSIEVPSSGDEQRSMILDDGPGVIEDQHSIAECPLPVGSDPSVGVGDEPDSKAGCDDPTNEVAVTSAKQRSPAVYIRLDRSEDIQVLRLSLPIIGEEQLIMEAVAEHPVVVICGETGSGKTTQLPQFLYEAGYSHKGGRTIIGVTEPRRVAAVSMCKRVAMETGLSSDVVSYQIRYEGNTTDSTRIKFMTDGVLLKEIERDFLLSSYSVIVIDEAHERSVYTDILIGLLSRIVPLRAKKDNPLRLVVMSATLRVEDFSENSHLFPSPPPIIKIDSRQYPVTIHFNKRTVSDYLNEAYRKVCKIHRMLRAGNILVFVTGQKEVHSLCRKLRSTFGGSEGFNQPSNTGCGQGVASERRTCSNEAKNDIDLNDYPIIPPTLEEVPVDCEASDTESASDSSCDEESHDPSHDQPLLVLPLYSLLAPKQQSRVFERHPDGLRVCVVATNVAETSLTIPGVKYVVDTGKVKRRYYDRVTGVSTFQVEWTSQASANQRAGRAGRTEPGHTYRLYSSAVFNNEFQEHSPPEIVRRPVDDLVLQMKALGITKVTNFPFPTPPPAQSVVAAEHLLLKLGALNTSPALDKEPPSISPLGRLMSHFPVSPRYAKMLALGGQNSCMQYVIALVAALSVREVFVEDRHYGDEQEDEVKLKKQDKLYSVRRSWAGQGEHLLLGDLMVLLRAVGACEYANCTTSVCESHGLRHKAILEIRKLRQQLTNAVNSVCADQGVWLDPKMTPPSQDQARCMRQIVLTGLGDHVARKIPTQSLNYEDKKRLRNAYQSTLCDDPVFIHRSSALYHSQPEFVVFQEIVETKALYMRTVCAVEQDWLPKLLPQYCTFSSPLDTPPPSCDPATGTVRCHMTCTYGNLSWSLPSQDLPFPDSIDKYKLFAQFLLQGKVVPYFSTYTPHLLVTPLAMVRNWSKLHRQCEDLLNALLSFKVCSRQKLLEIWEKEPKYLLKAYSMWLPQTKHKELSQSWPPKMPADINSREP